MQLVLELGDDPEVAAAPAQRPQEVGILLGVRSDELSLGGHDVGSDDVVARESVLSHEPADAAAECEPADACDRVDSAGRGEPESLRGMIDLTPRASSLRADTAGDGIDPRTPHRPQVDDEPTLAGGGAGDVVAGAANRGANLVRTRPLHAGDHVRDVDAARDHRRVALDVGVPELAYLVVRLRLRLQQLASKLRAKLAGERARNGRLCHRFGAHLDRPTPRLRALTG